MNRNPIGSAFRTVRDILARSHHLPSADYRRQVLHHAHSFRQLAGWLQRVQGLAAARPALAARGIGMSVELSHAMQIIEGEDDESPSTTATSGAALERASVPAGVALA